MHEFIIFLNQMPIQYLSGEWLVVDMRTNTKRRVFTRVEVRAQTMGGPLYRI